MDNKESIIIDYVINFRKYNKQLMIMRKELDYIERDYKKVSSVSFSNIRTGKTNKISTIDDILISKEKKIEELKNRIEFIENRLRIIYLAILQQPIIYATHGLNKFILNDKENEVKNIDIYNLQKTDKIILDNIIENIRRNFVF